MQGNSNHQPADMSSDKSQLPTTRVNSRVGRILKQRELQRTKDRDSSSSAPTTHGDSRERPLGETKQQRLLVVANRLPVSAKREGQDSWSLKMSAGGLVSALIGVKEFEVRYIGWPGISVLDEIGKQSLTTALVEKNCIPVFLGEELVHEYYNGYCNKILWPLFHYLGLPREDELEKTKSFQSKFESYKMANQIFFDVVNQHYEEGDVVWCHDYHLMFLPQLLKECNSKMKVGWFLHTPFPSSEIYRTLPTRVELLRAVLAADLVGFHTFDYARHFVSACTRVLGLEGTHEGVEDHGRLTRVAACPIGIDPERFISALETPEVQDRIKTLKEKFSGRKIVLGVDRLDMIKGIPHKILAFEKYLEENPDWQDKLVLLQLAVPSRTDVPEYKKLKSQVHEIVGRVNGRFALVTGVPIYYLDQSREFLDLCALYSVTDVALVTSLRDGMNLVSYEFVACQDSKKGVLVLSEFAGAAQSLGAGAILVNPWNITEIAAAIEQALRMPAEEREKRHRHNFEHVKAHTSQKWAELFVSELNDTVIEAQKRITEVPPQLVVSDAVERYFKCNTRLLILGFNVVLTEAVYTNGRRGGDQIREMELKLRPELKEPLKMLCRDPNTTVVVLSGSSRSLLDDIFKEYDVWLASENGMYLRSATREWIVTKPELSSNMDWVDSVKQVFEYFTERTPRSLVARRDTSLVWNYKYSDFEFGRIQARDMLEHLNTGPISGLPVDVVQGSRSVEVRASGISKGATIERILTQIYGSKSSSKPIDYVLCLGHFIEKDEDIYTFFEGELSPEAEAADAKADAAKHVPVGVRIRSKSQRKKDKKKRDRERDKKSSSESSSRVKAASPESAPLKVINLAKENYFSCAVGRTRTRARYLLSSTDDVVALLKQMATPSQHSTPSA